MTRQKDGRETWQRLLNWDKGQAPSERLTAQLLLYDKYESVDPSHPLGGPDGLKDIICKKGEHKFIAASYFSRGQQNFKTIKEKFENDSKGIETNNVEGIILVTNQELRLSERDEIFNSIGKEKVIDLYHLERISAIMNTPVNYGLRLEFLDIEMTKEEQLASMAAKDQLIHNLTNTINQLLPKLVRNQSELANATTVVPESLQSYGSPIHRCSYCKYGFKIAGRYAVPSSQYAFSLQPINLVAPLLAQKITSETVTCPKCGNTDPIY